MPIITTNKVLHPRTKYDYYPTPRGIIRAALNLLPEDFVPRTVLDPGAGDGVWGIEARKHYPDSWIVGVEIRDVGMPEEYSWWGGNQSFLADDSPTEFDLVIGNPPFYYAEEFIRKSMDYKPKYVLFLLRLTFLASQKRYHGLFKEFMPWKVVVSSRRPSFSRNGRTDADDYAMFIWKDGWDKDYFLGSHFYWEYLPEDLSNV